MTFDNYWHLNLFSDSMHRSNSQAKLSIKSNYFTVTLINTRKENARLNFAASKCSRAQQCGGKKTRQVKAGQ